MRAILINPFDQSISEVDHNGDYKQIYTLIDCEGRLFSTVRVDRTNIMYLDDEGLFQPNQRFFIWEGYQSKLAGRALILGCDEMGETVAADLPMSTVWGAIRWEPSHLHFAGIEESIEDNVETGFGPGTVITRRARFETEN